ncbi:MAG TPA: dihydropteroate synthase [Candidatus Marinimicrobia bacterium]|nr:MAG: dihydropteroate synthase [Candidatus Marinimicrobia bacterium CG_4_10_14_0_2_um_filter_48_9]PJA54791.1 MAG: dihydropteroate synthase [Candidatus Marinimicrobia bacterium CG_4_9_14_3_um_filter_48_9]HCW77448.1 dihydropteroate synthase [Candidatus Neomarinimicrobiota bacterium]
MGILNVTPDSFSDGGQFINTEIAIEYARQMVADGARIIDIGGESTRPGSMRIDQNTELDRVIPVIEVVSKWEDVLVSVDTYKSQVAAAAIEAGAHIVNDISGGRLDPNMLSLIAGSGSGFVMMHMQGLPETMQQNPVYDDVINAIYVYFQEGIKNAVSAGVKIDQIILDPGIGFGKTLEHNLTIIKRLNEFESLGRPLLMGVSRKSFIDKISPATVQQRLPGSLVAGMKSIDTGARILRVHDVAETMQALKIYEHLRAV